MSKGQYPISRNNQIQLWRECIEDANIINGDIKLHLPIAQAFFQYRIQIISDLAKIYGDKEEKT